MMTSGDAGALSRVPKPIPTRSILATRRGRGKHSKKENVCSSVIVELDDCDDEGNVNRDGEAEEEVELRTSEESDGEEEDEEEVSPLLVRKKRHVSKSELSDDSEED